MPLPRLAQWSAGEAGLIDMAQAVHWYGHNEQLIFVMVLPTTPTLRRQCRNDGVRTSRSQIKSDL
jgi:hypothetical protein